MQHISVLKSDVEKYLELKKGDVVVDATLGLGGHAEMIAEKIGPKGKLLAFEQDERNLKEAKKSLGKYKNVNYIHDNFCHLKTRVTGSGVKELDAIFFDLGLSSPHVDEAERGFSFMKEGPLDMRFDQRGHLTAADVLNNYEQDDLKKIFYQYAEDSMSPLVARKICEYRKERKFTTTTQFAEFLENVLPKKRSRKKSSSHPATKFFQALRIVVNDEMNVLRDALEQAVELLGVGGRIVVIAYHSLEDRLVKQFFRALERPEATPEESVYSAHGEPIFLSLTKKPVVPGETEILENPRSRSAKLRAYRKLKPYSYNKQYVPIDS